jgi:signal transduction histidine kinase
MKRGVRDVQWLLFMAMLIGVALCFAAGYAAVSAVFRFTGRPAEVWAHVVTGLTGLGIFALGMWLVTRLHGRASRGRAGGEILGEAIAAMNRIARGDFSVLIPVERYSPFSDLAESVNKMARELGTMEGLRQDFISNVSHEIQSPLTSISGFAALLRDDALPREQREHYINVIEAEARRLSKLSDNLLRLSALESGAQPLNLKPFSLDGQIQNAVLMLEPQWLAKDLELSLSLEKIAFDGDEGLLGQVWINLIQNAIKFTPDRGQIGVALAREGGAAVCRVTDTGVGISEEDQMRVFERFYKADKARDRSLGGNGLGLSIAKKIVELHGGSITVESRVGEGSIFTVSLPLKK